MSFIKQKKTVVHKETNPTKQIISDSYTEITGSRGEITQLDSSNKLVYRFNFNIQTETSTASKWFLHIKLQKSNDNFSSNIVDIQGANYNIASDSINIIDHLYRLNTAFFVIDGLAGTHQLRLVCRSYSNSLKPQLHQTDYYDGAASTKVFDTSLLILEV
tara:strand:+ start:795 stop:1274 length:480 start_codon:yes stop_codon:yes gene_type:complete